jgi:hypothetical protein
MRLPRRRPRSRPTADGLAAAVSLKHQSVPRSIDRLRLAGSDLSAGTPSLYPGVPTTGGSRSRRLAIELASQCAAPKYASWKPIIGLSGSAPSQPLSVSMSDITRGSMSAYVGSTCATSAHAAAILRSSGASSPMADARCYRRFARPCSSRANTANILNLHRMVVPHLLVPPGHPTCAPQRFS